MLSGRVFVGPSHDKAQEEWPYPGDGDDPGIARKSGAGRARGFVICHFSSVTATHAWPRLLGNRRKQLWRWDISRVQDCLLGPCSGARVSQQQDWEQPQVVPSRPMAVVSNSRAFCPILSYLGAAPWSRPAAGILSKHLVRVFRPFGTSPSCPGTVARSRSFQETQTGFFFAV